MYFSSFFKVNMLFTSLLFTSFLIYNDAYTVSEFILTLMGAFSSGVILSFIYFLVLYPLNRFMQKWAIYVGATLFFMTNLALVVDFLIFRLYKFHINAMVLNILTSPSAYDSLQIGFAPVILFLFLIFLFIGFEYFLIYKFKILNNMRYFHKFNGKAFLFFLLFIVLVEKVSYGFASLHTNNGLLSKFSVIPLYQPLTFNRVAAKYFDYKPPVTVKNTIQMAAVLDYPKKAIVIKKDHRNFPIFIFASDAVRADMMQKDIAPNIMKFAQDGVVFHNHHSGGIATRFGIFSFMYGINATYWFPFLNANKGSVLFDVLKRLDYKIDIISATNTDWPEFKKTCYVDVQKYIKDDFHGVPWEKDTQASEYFIKNLENIKERKKIFSFVFFDAPHGYSFPLEYDKFKANGQNINYLSVSKGSKEINSAFAGYKNAIYYDDKLFGKMIHKIKEKGLYDDALIIFTSDHGQEFYEYGNFGHNSAFSLAQNNSAFVIKLPKSMQKELKVLKQNSNKMTSHIDVVPSLLALLGVENKSEDFSNGYNFFHQDFHREFVFVANWNKNAIIDSKYTYVFSNLPNKLFKNEVRKNSDYKKVQNTKIDGKIILKIMDQNRLFLH